MRARVMIVDDNPTNLKLACIVLEDAGYEVIKAIDSRQALEILKTDIPDIILMDIALPGMDGLALTGILKKDVKTKNIVIVAMTAFAMKGDDQKALAAGCDGYISKPIDTRTLPNTVAGFLNQKRQ